jgi:hypothetical protein
VDICTISVATDAAKWESLIGISCFERFDEFVLGSDRVEKVKFRRKPVRVGDFCFIGEEVKRPE